MIDSRKDIPIGCAINIAIINEIKDTEIFKKACIEVPLKYGIIPPKENLPWPFYNLSLGSYIMYCLFVVSKELYNIQNDDQFFQNLVVKNAFQNFNVLKEKHSFSDKPLYYFKSFRNAISHVNYIVDDNDNIKLWDHLSGKSEPENWHWDVEISLPNFYIFLGLVNVENFNFYNEIKSGKRNQDGTIVN